MREIFYRKTKKEKKVTKKQAFNELIQHISCFHQWNNTYTLRLKEVLFIEDYDPFSAKELNSLTVGKQCQCPIRTGLINWVNNNEVGQCLCSNLNFPSQQDICDKGPVLAKEIFK